MLLLSLQRFLNDFNFQKNILLKKEYPATKYRGLVVFIGGFNANIVQNIGMLLGWFLGKNLVYLTGKTIIEVI